MEVKDDQIRFRMTDIMMRVAGRQTLNRPIPLFLEYLTEKVNNRPVVVDQHNHRLFLKRMAFHRTLPRIQDSRCLSRQADWENSVEGLLYYTTLEETNPVVD